MSRRILSSPLLRTLSRPVAARRLVLASSRSASTSISTTLSSKLAFRTLAGAVLVGSAAAYYLSNPILLDEARPRTKIGGGGKKLRSNIPFSEIEEHKQPGDIWVLINDEVWDLSKFLESHPGGEEPLLKFAGRDGTPLFNSLHPPGTIEKYIDQGALDPSAFIGTVDASTVKKRPEPRLEASTSETQVSAAPKRKIELGEIVGLPDFTEAARQVLPSKAFAYYSSGGTDEYTLGLNRSSYNQILFRPRVLQDVLTVDTSTTFLGEKVSLPIFVCPCGMAKLSHPEGEKLFASAAGKCSIAQFISTNASAPLPEILSGAVSPEQPFFMQLYVDRKRDKTEALMKQIEYSGHIKGYFVTVDAAAPGKREADERSRAEVEVASGISGGKIQSDAKGGGIGRSVGGFIDPSLNWEDLRWLRSRTTLPIGLKGIQTVEDAKRAYDAGINAIYLSNHGARALDGSPPALYTLLELNKFYPEIVKDPKCEIYLDGGVRRGTDVVKALCLGVNGVGIGRPFMYALTMGEAGVIHGIEIMRDEIETTLRLLGVTKLSQLGPHLLNTRALDPLIADKPSFGPDEQQGSKWSIRT